MDDATYTFDASYDEEGAALAERYFYLRTIRERRPWSTFGPPIFWVLVLVIANAVEAPAWFLIFALVAFALSAAGPAFFYLARPLEARRLARKHPTRRIAITPSEIRITAGPDDARVAWHRVEAVWLAGDYLLLVLGKYVALSIPVLSLPPGAQDFIYAATRAAE